MGDYFETRDPVTAKVGERPVVCQHCDGTTFGSRRIKLNTSGAEFLGFAWANRESLGLICTKCGSIQEFLEGVVTTRPVS